jgi:competence protein ComEC
MFQLICIAWIVGVSTIGQPIEFIPSLPTFSFIFLLLYILISLCFHYRIRHLFLRNMNVLLATFTTFILAANFSNEQLVERLKYRENKIEHVEVIVAVNKLNQLREDTIQQEIIVLNKHSKPVRWLSTLKKDKGETFKIGHYYKLSGKIKPVHSYATQGVFDIEKWYIQQDWMANFQIQTINELNENDLKQKGYLKFIKENNSLSRKLQRWVETKRLEIRNYIYKQPIKNKGLTLALLTGDESLLSKDTEEQFQRFGMSHLLAISGPHVLILATMVCWIINLFIQKYFLKFYLKVPRQYLLITPFLICVFFYCAYVGFEIPALRTLLTCCVVSLWLLLKLTLKPLTILLFSATILLIIDPFSILSAGFWLSYGACFVLLRIYQTIQQNNINEVDKIKSIKNTLRILIESQWKIFIALFPLMIIFFKQIAWITPLTNLIAIPIIGLIIVPLDVVAGTIFLVFEPLSHLLFLINSLCISLLLNILDAIDYIFNPQLIPISMNLWTMLLLILIIGIAFSPNGTVPKLWAGIGIIPLVFSQDSTSNFEMTILDVGQGQSIFIKSKNESLMIDTGGYYDETRFSVGKQIIQPFMSVNGVKEVKYLVLTHLDQDHSGAYDYLKQKFKFEKVYSNENVEVGTSSSFKLCEQNQQIVLSPKAKLTVLSPNKEQLSFAKYEKNENSCVLYLELMNLGQYQKFLFMADAGWKTESEIINNYPNLKVDVLILGHHGSQHSSSKEFLAFLKPKIAIASAGFDNRYNHPHPNVIAALKELNIPFMSTIDAGSIYFKSTKNDAIEITTERESRLWLLRDKLD